MGRRPLFIGRFETPNTHGRSRFLTRTGIVWVSSFRRNKFEIRTADGPLHMWISPMLLSLQYRHGENLRLPLPTYRRSI